MATRTVLIEDKASGIQLIQELRREGLNSVTPYKPTIEKVMRLQAQTPTIEQGCLYLPDRAAWRAAYVRKMTSFPKGRYDDQVGSTAQALEWIEKSSGPARWLAMMDVADREFDAMIDSGEGYRRGWRANKGDDS